MSYTVKVGNQAFELDKNAVENFDAVELSNGKVHVLKKNQAYDCEILEHNFDQKTLTVLVNGNKYAVQIADEYDRLVEKMGLSAAATQRVTDVKAPMPGLVLDVLVEAGQAVEKGTALLILEAMKMENVLKAEGAGVVKEIKITKGAAVDKGQLLIAME
jgi:biotin carboxyl carrier protein